MIRAAAGAAVIALAGSLAACERSAPPAAAPAPPPKAQPAVPDPLRAALTDPRVVAWERESAHERRRFFADGTWGGGTATESWRGTWLLDGTTIVVTPSDGTVTRLPATLDAGVVVIDGAAYRAVPRQQVVTLTALEPGDRACYLHVQTEAGAEIVAADFVLCEDPLAVGERMRLERSKVELPSVACAGDPECAQSEPTPLATRMQLQGEPRAAPP